MVLILALTVGVLGGYGACMSAKNKLQDSLDKYTQANETERKNIEVMQQQIGVLQNKVHQQRRAMGGVNASRDNQAMVSKQ